MFTSNVEDRPFLNFVASIPNDKSLSEGVFNRKLLVPNQVVIKKTNAGKKPA